MNKNTVSVSSNSCTDGRLNLDLHCTKLSVFLRKDDLIVAMTEQGEGLLGSAARIPEDDCYLHNQRLGLVTVTDDRLINKQFLYWIFNSPSFRHQLRGSATGTKVKHTAPERIYKVTVSIPSVETQAEIASILDKYDYLIETNRRRIALLEESARLLYREWFVNLRFPGHESVKWENGLSESWQLKQLSSVAEFINGYAFKPSQLQDDGFPVVKIPELRDGVSDKTPKNPGDAIPERNKIDTGDLLFSWSATLLVNEWSDGSALLNQHLFKVKPRNDIPQRYIRFALEAAIPSLLGQTVGATMQHIRKSALDDHSVFEPTDNVLSAFCDIVDPICDQIITLKQAVKQLINARDELLPKLMSGTIQI